MLLCRGLEVTTRICLCSQTDSTTRTHQKQWAQCLSLATPTLQWPEQPLQRAQLSAGGRVVSLLQGKTLGSLAAQAGGRPEISCDKYAERLITYPSIAGDLSGRELPRDLYLRVMGSRGGLLGPQRSACA